MRSTPTERTREQLEAVAVAGLGTVSFVRSALEVVGRAVPFAAACVATIDPRTQLATGAHKVGTMADVVPAEDELWAFHEYVVDDLYDYRDLLERDGGVTTVHRETAGDPLRCLRYENFFHPTWAVTDELRAAATVDGQLWALLALFRDDGTRVRTFNEAEMDFLSSVSPVLARGLRACLVTSTVAALAPSGVVDGPDGDVGAHGEGGAALGTGVLLVDLRGGVLSANAAAGARIAALGGGPVGRSELPMPVQSVVKAARRFGQGRRTWAPRVRVRTASGRWMVLSASPMAALADGAAPAIAVTIEDAGAAEVLPLLVAAHGLSPREQDVVALVLGGSSTAEISARLHLSGWTVQDHLKSVFAKVGVRSRRELTAKVFTEEYVPRMGPGSTPGPSGFFG